MPIINRIADYQDELTEWRRYLHKNPELGFEEFKTSDFVANKLEGMGLSVHRGLAGTGVVATLSSGDGSGKAIALRADMDALPLQEKGSVKHRSENLGKMHACGHDGHTTMLLGAAKYLTETQNFNGTVQFVFQPAEEGKGGGKKMIDDGLFNLFPAEEVYGMHNMPGMNVGEFAVAPGPMMAARDNFEILVQGRGAHAAMPHQGVDPVVVGSHIVLALQTITSRNINPQESLVVSVTQFHAGEAFNIIPDSVLLKGTCRVFDKELQDTLPERMRLITDGVALTFGAKSELTYHSGYPATINTKSQSEFCAEIAQEIAGSANGVDLNPVPSMGAEDFSYMLQERPGCYIWAGNGDSAGLHHPEYDFNDQLLAVGASYWSKLVEQRLFKAS
ncbi:M20 family metallopeptidase [Rhodospirillaceae bacterium]|nr:amidohydrolase [Rhodospirillaceae bacterium]MBT6307783.1 amidohydrolase [Rhodospirillaceae bacterium]MDC0999439.1 M20 family metallopeptidase [Alphaproteobacteria bacterium]MDC1441734.1 M20 family metallopeptidase [Rhodospirillaceae bacterium]